MRFRTTNPLMWLGAALVVAIGLMVILGTLTMSTYGGYYGMMGTGSWGWGFVMMAAPGFVLVLILLAALSGLADESAPTRNPPPAVNPLEILDQRYARGELNREEYLRARTDLGQGRINS